MLSRAPELGAAFADKLHFLDRPLAAFSELQAALGIDPADKTAVDLDPSRMLEAMLTIVTPAALQFVLSGRDVFRHAVFLHPGPRPVSASMP